MSTRGYGLGIDFGTSHTVAVIGADGGRAEPLLFDSSLLLPSGVLASDGGELHVGRDAERGARQDPAGYEPNPKRRLTEGTLLLGSTEVSVGDAVAAVLRRVVDEARRTTGRSPDRVVLTHPADWGLPRRRVLVDAATRAGAGATTLVPEPVAAAVHFTGALGRAVRVGSSVVVYDFGGGTFDVSVLRRRRGDDWDVVAADGLQDCGGVDLDAAVVEHVGTFVARRDPEAWERLRSPRTTGDRRNRRLLWEDARVAKEQLSRVSTAVIPVPVLDLDVPLTRDELERLARPLLDRTIALTTSTLFRSNVGAENLAGIFLVGGASRMPLAATLLHRALGVPPVVLEQPELVVALGSLRAAPPEVPPAVEDDALEDDALEDDALEDDALEDDDEYPDEDDDAVGEPDDLDDYDDDIDPPEEPSRRFGPVGKSALGLALLCVPALLAINVWSTTSEPHDGLRDGVIVALLVFGIVAALDGVWQGLRSRD